MRRAQDPALVTKLGPTLPWYPSPVKPKIDARNRKLKEVLNDYLDFLAELEKMEFPEYVDRRADMDDFVRDLQSSLRLLKASLNALN